jgi:hypothetical protein
VASRSAVFETFELLSRELIEVASPPTLAVDPARSEASRDSAIARVERPAPTALQIARAIPEGSQRAAGQAAFLDALTSSSSYASLRADSRRTLYEITKLVVDHADWSDMTSRPTWRLLAERTGKSRSTIAAWLAWLRTNGFLGTVASGWTSLRRVTSGAHKWARTASDGDGQNLAAVYVLTVPKPVEKAPAPESVEEHWTLSGYLPSGEIQNAGTCAREAAPRPDQRRGAELWRWTTPVRTRNERLRAAQRLQERLPALRRTSTRALRHALRGWFDAGWTCADIAWALDHAPSGPAHTWTTDVRNVDGWLRHRLAAWLVDDAIPSPPSAREAAVRDAARAAHAARTAAAARRRSARSSTASASASSSPAHAGRPRPSSASRPTTRSSPPPPEWTPRARHGSGCAHRHGGRDPSTKRRAPWRAPGPLARPWAGYEGGGAVGCARVTPQRSRLFVVTHGGDPVKTGRAARPSSGIGCRTPTPKKYLY